MKRALKFLKIALFLGLIVGLAACGKMSSPRPIEGSGYPHTYPKI